MEQFQFSNNLEPLRQSRNNKLSHKNHINNWLIVSPRQVTLGGMLLTANFNIQNAHQHLSVKFLIKSYINSDQVPFLQIFPQKGNIMRGEMKKVRVKFAKQFKPQINNNGTMRLKIFISLNTEFNRQYMKANRLSGWQQIKDLPIQQYEVPILISDQYRDIKQNIRQSVMFQSEFGKVSQDISSFYGQQKFAINEIGINSKTNLVKSKQKPRYSQLRQSQSRRSVGGSQKKQYKQNYYENSKKKQIYFGKEPIYTDSRIQYGSEKHLQNRSRSHSHASIKNNQQEFSSIRNNNAFGSSNNFISGRDIFKHFDGNQPVQTRQAQARNDIFKDHQDSSLSILRSLEGMDSRVKDRNKQKKFAHNDIKTQKTQHLNFDTVNNSHEAFKDFHAERNYGSHKQVYSKNANKRSIQLIVLAIIAGFFVALGSNIGRLFS